MAVSEAMRILYVRLPCRKIYPVGVTCLASYIHTQRPEVAQHILDMALIPKGQRRKVLTDTIEQFSPEIVAFSWRDIQTIAPIFDRDDRFPYIKKAFEFYYSPNPLRRLVSSFSGLKVIKDYLTLISENTGLVRVVTKRWPRKRVIVGGSAFSVFSEQLIEKLPEGVVGIVGEGEAALLKLADSDGPPGEMPTQLHGERIVWREGDTTFGSTQEAPVNLSLLEIDPAYIRGIFPQWEAYRNSSIGVQTKRGCYFNCSFCLYNYIEGREVHFRDPAVVVREVERFYREWGVKEFWFADAQFIASPKAVEVCEDLLERLVALNLPITWGSYIRANLITPKLAELMVASRMGDIEVSITSGSQKIVDHLTLGFRVQEIMQGCRYLKDAGYKGKIYLNFSLNAPGETLETLQASIVAYKEIAAIFDGGPGRKNDSGLDKEQVRPLLFFIGIQPHTNFEEELMASGYLDRGYNPLSLNPKTIRKMMYNPAPLDKLLARTCLEAWDSGAENVGAEVFWRLEQKLTKSGSK